MVGPEALIIGLDLNGLGVLRSLAPHGVTTSVLVGDMQHPSARTRYGRLIGCARLSGAPLLDALMAFEPRCSGTPVLFLTQELSIRTVAENYQDLQQRFRFTMPDPKLVLSLMNKDNVVPFAKAAGLAQPASATVRHHQDIAATSALRLPLIIKPTYHSPAYSARFKKAYVIADIAEAHALIDAMLEVHDEIQVQEWIAGGDDAIYFCLQYIDASGAVRASFTGRKTASWPPRVGGTAGCVAAPEAHQELDRLTTRFFATAGFRGLCSIEYKQDSRDGQYYLVEPTVSRTNYQSEIASLNGVNIPLTAYCCEAGLPAPALKPGKRHGWIDEGAVISGAKPQYWGRHADGTFWRAKGGLARLADPMPIISYLASKVAGKLTRRSHG